MPDYIVIRPGPGLPDGFLPDGYDGQWFDINRVRVGPALKLRFMANTAVATPIGTFETRDDGAVAEVWEVSV